MKKFLNISRPRFWIYTAGPFWLSAALLYPLDGYMVPVLIMLSYFTFPANILIYGINDIYDRDTDILNEKKNSYEHLLQSKDQKYLIYLIVLSNVPFWIYSVLFLPVVANIFLLIFILLAWQYSAPPIRAKARPFLDSLFSGLLYIVPVGVSWGIVSGHAPGFLPMLAGFLWSYSMHVYSAIPDINADKEAGISTSATYFGKNTTVLFCGLLYTLSSIIAYYFIGFFSVIIWLIYMVLIYLSYKKETPEGVLSIYKIFPLINTLVGGMLFIIFLLLSQGVISF